MSDPSGKHEPYELAPENPEAGAPVPKAQLAKPSVLEGFEEDADFSKDPEVEAALKGKPLGPKAIPDAPPDTRPVFVRPGFGNQRVWATVGAVLLVASLIAVAVTTGQGTLRTVAAVLLMLYKVLVHTATGVIAVWLAAILSEERLGRVELAAARMFAAVSAMALFFSVRISIFGNAPFERNIWSVVFGAAAYLALVAGLFRLWGHKLVYVIGAHLGLWLLVQVGMLLSAYVSAVPAAPAP